MASKSQALKFTIKLAICLVLVAWILHAIFAGEAENALNLEGRNWAELTLSEQVSESWSIGPASLWTVSYTQLTLPTKA